MIRTQIQLTERQTLRLKALASKHGIAVAELICRAIDHTVDSELLADEDEVRLRALRVVGKYTDTATDVSEEHDRYLVEAYGA